MISISCSFLHTISPTEFTQQLSKYSQNNHQFLNPIWLHNQGQNVLGILPKKIFSLYPNKSEETGFFANFFNRQFLFNNKNTSTYYKEKIKNISIKQFVEYLINYQKTYPSSNKNTNQNFVNFTHGLMGFISYDVMANYIIHKNLTNYYLAEKQPLAYLGHYDIYLTCECSESNYQWRLHIQTEEAMSQIDVIKDFLYTIANHCSLIETPPLLLNPVWQFSDYQQAFNKTQDYLHAGDCYQINLTQPWQAQLNQQTQLANYLVKLHNNTQTPFAGYLNFDNFELLSCSPELFFSFYQNNNKKCILTKPIKGTRPRGTTTTLDEQLKIELAHSEKDQAENVMIVDLLRNDLGKYAEIGTVKVPELFAIESFSNVHHMVSSVTAILTPETHPFTVLFGGLPAGSITGTPKKRAIEIIHELENQPRGAYCGTLGFMNFDGSGQWNVLIRTLQSNADKTVSLWAGGGITIASDCQTEYQECWDKVGKLLSILAN